ncbi:hypothetical protein [Chitinophaga rhizophila]|uniref:Uncharacterized protein n=1 Tax=Chitinophaga rhizophila TaxID=2866212 RepID=A0ABS7GHR9_9BACT|nr:hypothetical protein [Chitinophaga rhizophila]MBW8687250.1 hypothetical protein [Chitinophaga rhizophila]
MKRAKFVLAAVAVMAIAGGTLAFKSARLTKVLYFTTAGTTSCTFTKPGYATTTTRPNPTPVTTIAVPLAETPGICTTSTLYYTAE